ncbi:hypothetical protein [Leekyejoonella antrihumi]|uniref:PKD domain-containing protein n=1 Tax=Leekyejoonella antrihumi TaxID=1660198 RepID=A0A563E5Q5_9MICO|nr:hypothetical protein [Leekyejoonella antrihumi]TWP37573.1 hypothetical protein FGL98_04970 [Leekyejoonella antrihumi]
MPANEVNNLPKTTKAEYKKHTVTVAYQYRTQPICKNGDDPAHGCVANYGICIPLINASGPLVTISRRTVLPENGHGPWDNVGTTCYATLVPNTENKPQLTLAMIKAAWTKTLFAKPDVSIQPVGNRTLVTLPTYFSLNWPRAGYQPDEISTVTLLGHGVRIKPTFVHNTFTFGDGTTSGVTTSSGGPYPTGDITHAYDKAGTYTTSITTAYGGQFSVDNGPWTTIPGSINITGAGTQLRVVTATNRLVNH